MLTTYENRLQKAVFFVPVVVLKIIALILECIKRFRFLFSSFSSTLS